MTWMEEKIELLERIQKLFIKGYDLGTNYHMYETGHG